jgi:methylglutaconyl-CoA hydratase
METYQYITFSVRERIGWITLNRPDKRNALNFPMVSELRDAFSKAEADERVKVIVLKGEGKAFCAGADLEYLQKLQNYTFEENHVDSTNLMELYRQIYKNRKIVIAQIEGHALAGGCGLATVCDFAFAVPEASFGYTEVKIGFIPAIVSAFLLRKIGETRAKELLLGGEIISSETAARYNLINRVIDNDLIQGFVREFAMKLCAQNSGASMEFTKKMISDIPALPLDDALRFAAKMNAHARGTDDCKRGIAAFLNKEKLEW